MDVMMERGVTFDGIIGVSAGAAFGCNYKSGQIGRAIRYNMRFAHDKKYCSLQSFLKTGDLFGAEYAYHIVPEEYDKFDNEAFERNPMEFYVVCTDVKTVSLYIRNVREEGIRLTTGFGLRPPCPWCRMWWSWKDTSYSMVG